MSDDEVKPDVVSETMAELAAETAPVEKPKRTRKAKPEAKPEDISHARASEEDKEELPPVAELPKRKFAVRMVPPDKAFKPMMVEAVTEADAKEAYMKHMGINSTERKIVASEA